MLIEERRKAVAKISKLITPLFSGGEMSTLLMDMGAPEYPEEYRGDNKNGKFREVVQYMARFGRLQEFLSYVAVARPFIKNELLEYMDGEEFNEVEVSSSDSILDFSDNTKEKERKPSDYLRAQNRKRVSFSLKRITRHCNESLC